MHNVDSAINGKYFVTIHLVTKNTFLKMFKANVINYHPNHPALYRPADWCV